MRTKVATTAFTEHPSETALKNNSTTTTTQWIIRCTKCSIKNC